MAGIKYRPPREIYNKPCAFCARAVKYSVNKGTWVNSTSLRDGGNPVACAQSPCGFHHVQRDNNDTLDA